MSCGQRNTKALPLPGTHMMKSGKYPVIGKNDCEELKKTEENTCKGSVECPTGALSPALCWAQKFPMIDISSDD